MRGDLRETRARRRKRRREGEKRERKRTRVSCFSNRARDLRYLHRAFAPYVVPFHHCPNPAPRTLIDVPTSSLTLLLRFSWHLYFAAGRYQVTVSRFQARVSNFNRAHPIRYTYSCVKNKINPRVSRRIKYLRIFNIDILHVYIWHFIYICALFLFLFKLSISLLAPFARYSSFVRIIDNWCIMTSTAIS